MDIYCEHRGNMELVMMDLTKKIEAYDGEWEREHGERLYDHLRYRIKSDASMREKLRLRGLAPTTENALREMTDAIGLRIICLFIDDVYENVARIRRMPGCRVIREKDYIRDAKPNGYRSYHMILEVELPEDGGNDPARYYAEIQLRTIAMDTWAALEHEMKYKKQIENTELIARELHRCANELAACDVSMQTLKQIIRS